MINPSISITNNHRFQYYKFTKLPDLNADEADFFIKGLLIIESFTNTFLLVDIPINISNNSSNGNKLTSLLVLELIKIFVFFLSMIMFKCLGSAFDKIRRVKFASNSPRVETIIDSIHI